ncbi:hypothetical protein Baya_2040 [Bagarius yarrelli]|uniref:Uncharacterized protein n=1 Tax=Bagarius yarrelli TaxID=175774 RepID=A0A556TMV9_BAGYA|nr:hypothetical protein Baya_2040 [Bagarius yarrelli]
MDLASVPTAVTRKLYAAISCALKKWTSPRTMFGHKMYYVVYEALAPVVRFGRGISGASKRTNQSHAGILALALIGWEVLLLSGLTLASSRRGWLFQKLSMCGAVTRGFHDYRMTGKSLGTARVGGLSLKQIPGGL